jgi:hypothetical protein
MKSASYPRPWCAFVRRGGEFFTWYIRSFSLSSLGGGPGAKPEPWQPPVALIARFFAAQPQKMRPKDLKKYMPSPRILLFWRVL